MMSSVIHMTLSCKKLGLEMLLLKQVASENTLGQGLTLLTILWNQTDLGGWRHPSPVKFKV